MLALGDVHLYVTDLARALRFWAGGLQLELIEHEVTPHSGFARLDFPDGGGALRLTAPVDPYAPGMRPEFGSRPMVSFDITTTDLEALLVRLVEHGGTTIDEVEIYSDMKIVTIADPDGNAFDLIEVPPE